MYRIRLLAAAERDLAGLDKPTASRLADRLRWLAENFENVRPEPLTGGLSGLYRFLVGDYRIVYEALRDEGVLLVHMIGHRSSIYRPR